MKVALTGSTGKIGGSVLNGILKYNLISPKDLILCTSTPTSPKLATLKEKLPDLSIRRSSYDDSSSMVEAFNGCQKLFLVSTPHIAMDYNSAPPGQGREKHHISAISAAIKAGVEHIYYTSLAFESPSKAGVMVAHIRTEAFLKRMNEEKGIKYTIIREGLYNESWPLYFGHFLTGFKGEGEEGGERKEVVVAGDGPISWTGIQDLGVASALIIAEDGEKYDGKTLYLSNEETKSLKEVAGIVSDIRGSEVRLKVVEPEEYVSYYEEKGMERANLEWWVSSYAALEDGECEIKDPTFSELLASRGVKVKSVEETIREMLGKK